MIKTEGVSIIICSFNGALRLPETLKHLANQVVFSVKWEVILVSNKSTDNTIKVARETWSNLNCQTPLIIIDEPNPGKSNALKNGAFRAKYDYFIVCDDDNWLDPGYVQTSFEIMQGNSRIGVLGGDSVAVCETSPPQWFEAKKCYYAVGKQGEHSGDATARWFLWGAGSVLRKKVFLYFINAGLSNLLGGRKGNDDLTGGEDVEICKWYILAGYKLWYDNRLKIKHYITMDRLTESYFEKLWNGFENTDYWQGRYDILLHIKSENKSRFENLIRGLKYKVRNKKNVFVIKNIDLTLTYIQFLIGPYFRISTNEEFRLIKIMYPFLYKNLSSNT
jgi:glycosyltransferase involved in cell wall biosynthesis